MIPLDHAPRSHYEVNISVAPSFERLDDLDRLEESTAEITRIYLMRHGESSSNIKDENGIQLTSGKGKDIPLTPQGQDQADAVALKMAKKISKAVVLPSDSLRAQQTAASLVLKPNMTLGESLEGLCEVGMGKWEGQPKDEIYEAEYQKWKGLPANEKFITPKVETAETFDGAAKRALTELETLLKKEEGQTLIIVSHYHTMNALAIYWMRPQLSAVEGSSLPLLPFKNCDLLMIEIPKGRPIEEAQVKKVIHSL